ncbi:organic cation transporter protein-like [Lineus longissimus]|uniref:organic cation transporter protein-like n=1 Tax=Lineus longissimus TaxID=88925 RepID=UPI00315CC858
MGDEVTRVAVDTGCLPDEPAPQSCQSNSVVAKSESEIIEVADETDKTNKTFEYLILRHIGEFGIYQIRLFVVLTLMDLPTSICMSLFIFSAAHPGWHCGRFVGSNDTYNGTWPNSTSEMCEMNGAPCEEYVFKEDFTSIVTDWNLVCDYAYIPKMTVSIQMVGVLIGAILGGQAADTIGRKKTLLVAATVEFTMQSLLMLSNSWQLYTAMSFIKGVFISGSICVCSTLPMEFIGTRYRTLVGTVGIWGFGSMLMALVAWQLVSWRYLALSTGLMGIPLIFGIILFVPESIRWLIQKGRFDEAEKIIREMARVNKREVPDMSVLKQIAKEAEKRQKEEGQYSYHDLFRTADMAKRAAVIMLTWFTASLFAYGISNMYDTFSGTINVNLCISSAVSMVFAWSIIPSADRFGRRKTFFGYIMVPIACLTGVVIIGAIGVKWIVPDLVTALVLIGKGGIVSVWYIASIVASELFPTLMRNIAMGMCSVAARIGGILAPQVALLGQISHWTVPYIIIGLLSILCAVLFLVVLPETNKVPLQEEMPPRRRKKHQHVEENGIELTEPLNQEEDHQTNGQPYLVGKP